MAILTNWVVEAAKEIEQLSIHESNKGYSLEESEISPIIRAHCPFKQDVAYEEVPAKLSEVVEEFAGWWGLNREGSVNASYARIDEFVKNVQEILNGKAH